MQAVVDRELRMIPMFAAAVAIIYNHPDIDGLILSRKV
jgi:hypothetical protein